MSDECKHFNGFMRTTHLPSPHCHACGTKESDAARIAELEAELAEANQNLADMEEGLRKGNGSMIAYWFYDKTVQSYKKSLGAERAKRKKAERKAKRAASGGETR